MTRDIEVDWGDPVAFQYRYRFVDGTCTKWFVAPDDTTREQFDALSRLPESRTKVETRDLYASPAHPPVAEVTPDDTKDAARYRALKPFLFVGGAEGGETWGLWCIAPSNRDNDAIPAVYARLYVTDEEERASEAGSPFGPDVDAMVDEMVAALTERTPLDHGQPK